jgi:hypothetical protein
MEVAEVIALARSQSEALSRLARVLSRLKPLIYSTGTTIQIRFRDTEVTFHCMTVEDATKLAAALPCKLELAYRGASTTLYATVAIQDVTYDFQVPTIRKIRLDACELKRFRPRMGGRRKAVLLFCDLEIAKFEFIDRMGNKALKEKLWNIAIREKERNHRLEKFDFVV